MRQAHEQALASGIAAGFTEGGWPEGVMLLQIAAPVRSEDGGMQTVAYVEKGIDVSVSVGPELRDLSATEFAGHSAGSKLRKRALAAVKRAQEQYDVDVDVDAEVSDAEQDQE